MKIIIDGYNLIFAWGWMPKSDHRRASSQARSRLIQTLKRIVDENQRAALTIVFDAATQRSATQLDSVRDRNGFELLYAHGYPDADTLIEELIQKESAPQHLVVVSSDHRIMIAANRRRATVIRSEDFLDEMPKLIRDGSIHRPEWNAKIDTNAMQELAQTDWLAEFGLTEADAEQLPKKLINETDSQEITSRRTGRKAQPSSKKELDQPLEDNPLPPGFVDDLLNEFED